MRVSFFPLFPFVCASVLGLTSCASVSVDKHTEHATTAKPKKIYVAPFETAGGTFNVDREGVELADFKQHLQTMLQAGLVTGISTRLVPAEATKGRGDFPPENAWLIRGEFVRVNQGSRLLRGAFGFGAGGTKLETRVAVYDLNRAGQGDKDGTRPFLTFSTTGGSGAEPGAISGLATDPVMMAVQMAAGSGGIFHGVTEDAARTARQITAMLSDYMYRRDWIPEEKWVAPKRLER